MKKTSKKTAKPAAKKAAPSRAKSASAKAAKSTKSTKSAKSAKSSSAGRKSAGKASHAEDIVNLILEDHKPLKELIEIMKDSDVDLNERREAFEQFGPLLVSHAKPEEQVMYVFMKADEDLREEGFEGDVEHGLADQMMEEAKRTKDEDLFSARIKVLAELVEHHIEEEEEELLPDFRKSTDPEQRVEMGQSYLKLKDELLKQGGLDSPSERDMGEAEEARSER